MKQKTPAFQFYPSDYLSSQRVQMMSLTEEGAYLRLLCYCWAQGTLPADPEQLARIVGKGAKAKQMQEVAKMFAPCPDDPTRLIHERLEKERAKQKFWKEKSREGGKASASTRITAVNGSPNEQPPLNDPSTTLATVAQPKVESRGANTSVGTSVETTVVPSGGTSVDEPGPPIPCSPEDVRRHEKTLLPPFDEGFAMWWWNKMDSLAWVTKDGPIRRWKAAYEAARSSNRHNKLEREARGRIPAYAGNGSGHDSRDTGI